MAGGTLNDLHIAIVGTFACGLHGTANQLTCTLGAGVAGLALAMGLHKKGISFTLYEEANEYSIVG